MMMICCSLQFSVETSWAQLDWVGLCADLLLLLLQSQLKQKTQEELIIIWKRGKTTTEKKNFFFTKTSSNKAHRNANQNINTFFLNAIERDNRTLLHDSSNDHIYAGVKISFDFWMKLLTDGFFLCRKWTVTRSNAVDQWCIHKLMLNQSPFIVRFYTFSHHFHL